MLALPFLGMLVVRARSSSREGKVTLKTVAFTCQDLQNPFFKLMGDAVCKAAVEVGGPNVKVIMQSADNDLGKQCQQIDDCIAAGRKSSCSTRATARGLLRL